MKSTRPDKSLIKTVSFFVIGMMALAWFLIRVVPKPIRATYPCQRAAFPIATSFIIWLMGLLGSAALLKRGVAYLKHAHLVAGMACLSLAIPLAWFAYLDWPALDLKANEIVPFVPVDPPNAPIGTGRGVFPGRVVWKHDPAATSWDGNTGYWWSDDNTDLDAVKVMLSQSLRWLTESETEAEAWDRLFRHHNEQKGPDKHGYREGETIAIKLNMNQIGSADAVANAGNRSFTTPQLVLALLEQLVENAGVAPQDITFYDAVRAIPDAIADRCRAAYPGVRFMDLKGLSGRIAAQPDPDNPIRWSEEFLLKETASGGQAFIPLLLSDADYHINVAGLKGHDVAGVTFCAKNYLGSFLAQTAESAYSSSPKAAGVHPYLAVHETGGGWAAGGRWSFDARPMGTYTPLVDLMGHKDLGKKTILYIIDALYASPTQGSQLASSTKWQSEPFNDDWTSSLLISQDPVAIDSVALDLARSEPTLTRVYGNVDNYLHEAALASDPPSGAVYDPENDGTPMTNLGVHEHWNNAVEKKYSRNLGRNYGIELIREDPFAARWWIQAEVFGGLVSANHDPYYHCEQLGWFCVIGNRDESYFYPYQIPSMACLYSNQTLYPWFWSYDRSSWIYSLESAPGWFWDAATQEWFSCKR
jgi:hypothetical protein